ncbi:MAG TPA: indole-3-glycerol phosphate synthase TrpC [Prolixibacteraceae bacterium]|nr:indole-3-glycerol phosphate synthase TrpC [Prolixibacteraceae bacterium]
MSTILNEIVANRKEEVSKQKLKIPLAEIKSKIDFSIVRNSLAARLQTNGESGIIAEFKRRSPSKGVINDWVQPEIVTKGYADAGASGLSVLTDWKYFGGSTDDFMAARNANPFTPLLRKDFMVDEYQLYESRLLNADVILLIAAVLGKVEISRFTTIAHELGMEVLLELHDESEIDKIDNEVDMIGINNRNLKDFKVDMDRSLKLFDQLPGKALKISESGLSDPQTVDFLRERGFQGFLMGESFMKADNPATACLDFISKLKY